MANQLEGNNTQQKLIGGAARQPQRQARNEDVFVANVGENAIFGRRALSQLLPQSASAATLC